jgi:uncharacterized membrane protein YccC
VIEALRRLPVVGVRRAIRATVAASGTFTLLYEVAHNSIAAIFAAFGSLILLVYVEFDGPKRQRVEKHLGLIVLTVLFVFLGTLSSQVLWVAVVVSVLVSFGVLMLGVVSSSFAGATSAMLISFLLPVAFQGPLSSIPDRLFGWAIGGAASLLAVVFIFPAPSADPIVDVTCSAVEKIAAYLSAVAASFATGHPAPSATSAERVAAGEASGTLRKAFFAAPFRPAGLSASSRLLVKVIEWTLELDLLLSGDPTPLDESGNDDARILVESCAAVLEQAGSALAASGGETGPLERVLTELREARSRLEGSVLRSLHRHEREGDGAASDQHDVELLALLGANFRADNIANTVENLGADVVRLVMARNRTWWRQALGLEASGNDSRFDAVRRRLRSHFSRRSVWLHNSARGALGLGLSVLVAYEFGVEHAFWVVFGTLAVLRSNALSTGQSVVRALLGTIEGIVVGSLIIGLLGTHETVFWILLPFAVCFTGFAPSAISFAAGQAGLTMTILILFNIVEPIGWKIGVVRIEDVALGCAVSLVVGLLMWPRGASAALRYSISDGIVTSVAYLESSVAFGLARCERTAHPGDASIETRRLAQQAARRLDDAFREFLSERGSKSVSLADVSTLIAGVTAVRITADSIQELWRASTSPISVDQRVVREALSQALDSVARWYGHLSEVIGGEQTTLSAPSGFAFSGQQIVDAVRVDLTDEDGRGTNAAFKIVWTDDYLRQLHDLQQRLLPVVEKIASARGVSSRLDRGAREKVHAST